MCFYYRFSDCFDCPSIDFRSLSSVFFLHILSYLRVSQTFYLHPPSLSVVAIHYNRLIITLLSCFSFLEFFALFVSSWIMSCPRVVCVSSFPNTVYQLSSQLAPPPCLTLSCARHDLSAQMMKSEAWKFTEEGVAIKKN